MTDEKTKQQPELTAGPAPRKVTTGAWWKSVLEPAPEESEPEGSQEAKEAGEDQSAVEPQAPEKPKEVKEARRAKTGKEPKEAKEVELPEEASRQPEQEPQEKKEVEKEAEAAAPPARQTAENAEAAEATEDAETADPADVADVAEPVETKEPVEPPAVEIAGFPEPAIPTEYPESAESEESTEPGAAEESAPAAESLEGMDTPETEASAETPEPAGKRRGRKRSPRKKRGAKQAPVQEKQQEEPEEESEDLIASIEDEDVAVSEAESEREPERRRKGRKSSKKNKGKAEEKPEEQPEETEKQDGIVYKLLINAEEPEECRIAQLENGRLESFHVTTVVREQTRNNIYKGRIVSIEPNLQAAFVDIGAGRNGFLPFGDIHPEYYKQDIDEYSRKLMAHHQWKKLKIENVIQKGQEVLVQVVKEETGNKGANMTTYLSLPGRYLVLMPGSDSAGVSRKIAGEEKRAQLREIMSSFSIPEGIGYIIRTASAEITKAALQQDLRYLLNLWKEIKKKGQTEEAPALLYGDQDIVLRFLRDYFVPEIEEILVDTQESFDQVNNFISLLPASQRKIRVKLHRGLRPIFNYHNVEEQIESIYQPQVSLPSGGSIVINPTEALVAIDVNSGRTSKDSDFEETIFLANMEAAAELARQLRLRDLGGLIVVDFIDMRNQKHIREVEKQVKTSMKRDKAKVDISRISRFGLMQISRQKLGAPIERGSHKICSHCQGRGVVRSVETLALYYLRRIQTGILRKKVNLVQCSLPLDVAQYLLNKKRTDLTELENRHNAVIDIVAVPDMKPSENRIDFIQQG